MRPIHRAARAFTLLFVCLHAPAQICETSGLVETIPVGNSGALGALGLAPDAQPRIGQPFALQVRNGQPGAAGCVALSTAQRILTLPALQAEFHPALPAAVGVFTLDANGAAGGLFGVPTLDPALCGIELFAQSIAADPTAPGGFAVSDALRMVIGGPAPRFVYAHMADATIRVYLTDPNGVPVGTHPGSPFATGGTPGIGSGPLFDNRRSMVEVNGVLYTANTESHDISALRIEADGSLTPLPGSPFPSGGGPFTYPRSLAVHPSLPLLYVAHDGNGILGIRAIAPDGSLSEAFPSIATRRQGMVNLAIGPSGQAMWASFRVFNGLSQQMRAFSLAADGNATDLGNFGPQWPFANVIAHPGGRHIYAATVPGFWGNQLVGVFGFEVNLSPTPTFPVLPGSPTTNTTEPALVTRDLIAGPAGNYVYVLNAENPGNPSSFPSVHAFSVDTDGELTSANIVPLPPASNATSVLALSADGARLYSVGEGLAGFTLDGRGGLALLGTSPPQGGIATGLVVAQ